MGEGGGMAGSSQRDARSSSQRMVRRCGHCCGGNADISEAPDMALIIWVSGADKA
jgi:hypothetical protein